MRTHQSPPSDGKQFLTAHRFFTKSDWCARKRRFSIAAPLDDEGNPQGEEDFFSSDIKTESLAQTFGKIPKDLKVLFLGSGSDQFVPEHVDKESLMGRWVEVCKEAGVDVAEGSGWVKGATHEMKGVAEEVMEDFVGRVKSFLEKVGMA